MVHNASICISKQNPAGSEVAGTILYCCCGIGRNTITTATLQGMQFYPVGAPKTRQACSCSVSSLEFSFWLSKLLPEVSENKFSAPNQFRNSFIPAYIYVCVCVCVSYVYSVKRSVFSLHGTSLSSVFQNLHIPGRFMGSSEQQIFTIAPYCFKMTRQEKHRKHTHTHTHGVQYLFVCSTISHIRAHMHSRANCKMGLTKLGWHWRVESFYSSHQFFVGQRIIHLKQVKSCKKMRKNIVIDKYDIVEMQCA